MKNKNQDLGYSHGECLFAEAKIPSNAVRMDVKESKLKIADSEQTGNHHYVENAEGCEFYELDGIRYMRNSKPVNVSCVIEDRHDTFPVQPGEWEIGAYQEYDHITEQSIDVRD